MLSADEFNRYTRSSALPISLNTRQRWVHVNPMKAKQTHSAQEAKAAGFTIEQMKAYGYRPYQCKVAGFSFEEASRAGFVTWGSEPRDFWFSTGMYAGRGLDQIGRTYGW